MAALDRIKSKAGRANYLKFNQALATLRKQNLTILVFRDAVNDGISVKVLVKFSNASGINKFHSKAAKLATKVTPMPKYAESMMFYAAPRYIFK